VAKSAEEFTIFVERLTHFMNLWTVYTDSLTERYVPTVGIRDFSYHDPRTTLMFMLYAYFYSLVDESPNGLNAFKIWREQFPEEEPAIAAVEKLVQPFVKDLRLFRNRLGFHGSRSRRHESSGFDLFANHTGDKIFNTANKFKALAATLLYKDMAVTNSDPVALGQARERLDRISQYDQAQTSSSAS
jgi:hypothetical protein